MSEVHYAVKRYYSWCVYDGRVWARACDSGLYILRVTKLKYLRATTKKTNVTCGNCKRTKVYRRKK